MLSNKADDGGNISANDRVERVMAQSSVQGIRVEGIGANMSEGSKIVDADSP